MGIVINKQLKNIFSIYTFVGLGLFFSFIIRFIFKSNKPFNKSLPIIYLTIYSLNLWSLSHLILYILLGYFAPNLWYISLTMSVVWESIEFLLEDYTYIKFKSLDYIINLIGLIIGLLIHKVVNNKNKENNFLEKSKVKNIENNKR